MNKKHFSLIALMLISTYAVTGCSDYHAPWSYDGKDGPTHWGKLDTAYQMCGIGENQSPINIMDTTEASLSPLDVNYKAGVTSILNNGHTVQVNYRPDSTLRMDRTEFMLKQFHFHSPSENKINGVSYPMEIHLVHASKEGELAVVAVMVESGSSNPLIEALWKKMPEDKGDKNSLGKQALNISDLLPRNLSYYRFNGSLTTPPCSEGVRWYVLKTPVSMSEKQIEAFEHVMHHANNRPTQPLNARAVLR